MVHGVLDINSFLFPPAKSTPVSGKNMAVLIKYTCEVFPSFCLQIQLMILIFSQYTHY